MLNLLKKCTTFLPGEIAFVHLCNVIVFSWPVWLCQFSCFRCRYCFRQRYKFINSNLNQFCVVWILLACFFISNKRQFAEQRTIEWILSSGIVVFLYTFSEKVFGKAPFGEYGEPAAHILPHPCSTFLSSLIPSYIVFPHSWSGRCKPMTKTKYHLFVGSTLWLRGPIYGLFVGDRNISARSDGPHSRSRFSTDGYRHGSWNLKRLSFGLSIVF